MFAAFLLLVAALCWSLLRSPCQLMSLYKPLGRRPHCGRKERIDRYRRVAASRGTISVPLKYPRHESSRFFLKNSAPNLGGAELTGHRTACPSKAAVVRLTSIQPVTVKDEAGFRLYFTQCRIQCDTSCPSKDALHPGNCGSLSVS